LHQDYASEFEKEIRALIDGFNGYFSCRLRNPSYQQQKSVIDRAFSDQYEAAINKVEACFRKNWWHVRDASSVSFAPMKEGKALEEK